MNSSCRHQASRILRSHTSSPLTTVASCAVTAPLEGDAIHDAKLETISESLIHDSPTAENLLIPASPPTSRPTRRLSEGHIRKFVKNGTSYPREDSCYHWSLVEAQREFGRRVAAKLLGSDSSIPKGQVSLPSSSVSYVPMVECGISTSSHPITDYRDTPGRRTSSCSSRRI